MGRENQEKRPQIFIHRGVKMSEVGLASHGQPGVGLLPADCRVEESPAVPNCTIDYDRNYTRLLLHCRRVLLASKCGMHVIRCSFFVCVLFLPMFLSFLISSPVFSTWAASFCSTSARGGGYLTGNIDRRTTQ